VRAVMDWHSLFWADELFAPQGKLATIWFDKLVLQNTGEDSLEGAINILRETEQFSDATAETLKTIWVPVQTLIPNWAAGNSELLRSSPEDIRETVTTALKKRIRKEYGADFAETYPGIREVAWGSLLYLEAIQIWSTLNKSAPTTIVFNSTNYDIFETVIKSTVEEKSFQSFARVASVPIPNLSKLSWDEVLELRHHPYFENFRIKLSMLNDRLAIAQNEEIADLVSEIRIDEMEHIVRAQEPALGRAIINGLLNNIPGLPVNPYSIGSSVYELWKRIRRRKQSGWLYFLLRMEDIGRRRHGGG